MMLLMLMLRRMIERAMMLRKMRWRMMMLRKMRWRIKMSRMMMSRGEDDDVENNDIDEEEDDDVEEEERSQDSDARFAQACAIEMHMDMSQEQFLLKFTGEKPQTKTAIPVCCASLHSRNAHGRVTRVILYCFFYR